jgi:hypothetical protein
VAGVRPPPASVGGGDDANLQKPPWGKFGLRWGLLGCTGWASLGQVREEGKRKEDGLRPGLERGGVSLFFLFLVFLFLFSKPNFKSVLILV